MQIRSLGRYAKVNSQRTNIPKRDAVDPDRLRQVARARPSPYRRRRDCEQSGNDRKANVSRCGQSIEVTERGEVDPIHQELPLLSSPVARRRVRSRNCVERNDTQSHQAGKAIKGPAIRPASDGLADYGCNRSTMSMSRAVARRSILSIETFRSPRSTEPI